MNNIFSLFHRIPYIVAIFVAGIAFGLMFVASTEESAIMDELAHIPAGYGYVKHLDYRLNPEHPPLLKDIAAFPLLFLNLNFPTDDPSWTTQTNGQWDMGARFLYESGNDADRILFWSRIGPMILTIILGLFIYFWGIQLVGRWWALLPSTLFLFSPNVLAHGHYVTTDIAATFGFVTALYFLSRYFETPTSKNMVLAGIFFGVAQLLKFSNFLLVPLFIFFFLVHFFIIRKHNAWMYLKTLLLIFAIGYALVYVVYFLHVFNYPTEKQIADIENIFASENARFTRNTLVSMAQFPILKPLTQYLLGLVMVIQRAAGGNTAYFLGTVSNQGHWLYFPAVFLFKEPIPGLLFLFGSLIIGLSSFRRFFSKEWRTVLSRYFKEHFTEFVMVFFVLFYWGNSVTSRLNIGVRHVLPTLPFIYLLATIQIKRWVAWDEYTNIFTIIPQLKRKAWQYLLIGALILWYVAGSFMNTPYFLSYFNEFGGGVENGYKIVTDSNYDWGQDLKRLSRWTKENSIQHIAVDYFGGGSPQYYLGNRFEPWWVEKGKPSGWFAISTNTLQQHTSPVEPPLVVTGDYRWLLNYQPITRIGTSIFVYKIE